MGEGEEYAAHPDRAAQVEGEHPLDEVGDALPAAVALGDLGDDEAGKRVEEGGGEEDDRQGDAVHRAEDREGGARREPPA